MENIQAKANFLRNEYVKLLGTINPATKGLWGKMNVQQMIEHMSYSMRQASGKELYTILTAEEHLPCMQAFLVSEKPFRENTPNQLLPDEPEAAKQPDIQSALNELEDEINYFFSVYENEPGKIITNPFFGNLGYEQQVQLLHKHAWHHLRQFGVDA